MATGFQQNELSGKGPGIHSLIQPDLAHYSLVLVIVIFQASFHPMPLFGNNLFLSSLLLSFKYHFSHYLVIPMNYDNTTVVEISGHSVDSHMIPSLKNTVLIKCIFSCASNDTERKYGIG